MRIFWFTLILLVGCSIPETKFQHNQIVLITLSDVKIEGRIITCYPFGTSITNQPSYLVKWMDKNGVFHQEYLDESDLSNPFAEK